jgi:hypothetical protein
MIDTLKIFIDNPKLNFNNFTNKTIHDPETEYNQTTLFKNTPNFHLDYKERHNFTYKYYKNDYDKKRKRYSYNIIEVPDRLFIHLSLFKLLKDNYFLNPSYTSKDKNTFLEALNEELHSYIDTKQLTEEHLNISRADVALNIKTEIPINIILKELYQNGCSGQFKTTLYGSTLTFHNKSREICCYDKVKEVSKQHNYSSSLIKEVYKQQGNILRLEVRLMKKNICEKNGLNFISGLFNINNSRKIFIKNIENIINIDNINMRRKKLDTIQKYLNFFSKKQIIQDFGSLENFKQHLLESGFNRSSINRAIQKLRRIGDKEEKQFSLDQAIVETIRKIEAQEKTG